MPTIPEALNLAEQALAAGDPLRARFIFEQILSVVPDEPHALNGLGVVAFRADRLDEAENYHRRAIALCAEDPAFHNNLNFVCCRQGRPGEAVECCRRALALAPDSAQLHNNLGVALKQCGRFERAVPAFRRAVALLPEYGDAYHNLAAALVQLRRLDEATDAFRRALELAPGDAEAHHNHAMFRLLLGDFAAGWGELDWRWRIPEYHLPELAQPRWEGQSLVGRALLLVGEQGLGDVIQMIRFARLVKQSGTTVLVQCPTSLHALLKTAPGVDRFVNPRESNREVFDFYVPLLSLPGVQGTTVETIPAGIPYLAAEPARVERWRRELAPCREIKVGIAWQGRPTYALDAYRSIPLAEFAPLAACPGVKLFGLQKGHGREQLTAFEGPSIIDLGATLDEESAAFVDTAAVMMTLDLVITSDTAIAHLAGALGVPVWVVLSFVPDWRWLLDRLDSPWYPTMRLFRQTSPGDWGGVFQRIADELRTISKSRPAR